MNRNRYRRIVLMSGGATTPAPSPFGGVYTWWANMNNAVFSDSGGTDYVDSVPLTGISDQFEQPTAARRPTYIHAGLDANHLMRADTTNIKIYKGIDTAVFDGNGTFAFLGLLNNNGVFNKTFFTEAEAGGATYNFQISVDGANFMQVYTDADLGQTFGAFTYAQYAVHHFTLSGTTMSYYKNGVFVQSRTVNQNMTVAKPLTAFNYKSVAGEQGYGDMGDIVALTGTALDNAAIANDYANFWKVKYPSLP